MTIIQHPSSFTFLILFTLPESMSGTRAQALTPIASFTNPTQAITSVPDSWFEATVRGVIVLNEINRNRTALTLDAWVSFTCLNLLPMPTTTGFYTSSAPSYPHRAHPINLVSYH